LVIVGGIAGIAAWVTLLDIRRLAETAARNTDATITGQRPWILVKRIGNPPDGLVDPQNPHFNPGIGIQFQVYGNTPAEITDSKFCLQIVKRGRSFPPVPDLPAVPDYSMAASNPDLPAMMVMRPPRDRFNVIFTLPQPLTTAELEELQYQRTFLCAWGFIKYRDVFGGEGETSVCYIYDFANGGVLSTLDGIRLNPPGFRVGGPRSYNHTK
jgi:hypothetical protein